MEKRQRGRQHARKVGSEVSMDWEISLNFVRICVIVGRDVEMSTRQRDVGSPVRSLRAFLAFIMPEETTASPVIALKILFPHLEEFCIPRNVCEILLQDPRRAESKYNSPISINVSESKFECARSRVSATFKHGVEQLGNCEKYEALRSDSEAEILTWIQENARRTPLWRQKRTEIIAQRNFEFRWLADESIRSFFVIRMIWCKQNYSPRRTVSEWTRMGLSIWVCTSEREDRKTKKVVVPAGMGSQPIHPRRSCNRKHVSLIAWISAAGAFLTLYIVTSQDSQSLREQL
jgi:hypothetical protein